MSVISVVIMSDTLSQREALTNIINNARGIFTVLKCVDLEQAKSTVIRFQPEVILCALKNMEIPVSLIKEIKIVCPQTALVLMTEQESPELVITSLTVGVDACVGLTSPGYLMRILELVCRGGIMVFPRSVKSQMAKMANMSKRLAPNMLEEMTDREKEIFNLLIARQTNKEIASGLYISESTVKSHVRNILQKIGVKNRIELKDSYDI
jgi:two-component system nitrate/nitrite response regulator NarL